MNSPNATAPLMNMTQNTLQNPVASAVPQPQGGIDAGVHPVVAGLIKLLANAAQSYGWTSMPPQQRMQAQEMEQQKAEAMARLGMQQQQLGYEGQRVGFEGQRTEADVAASKAAAKRSNVEAEEAPKRTAIESRNVDVNKQRADNEHEYQKANLKREAEKVAAEYGPGGLRSQEVAAGTSRAASEASRAATDAKLADIADRREQMEKEYKQAEAQRAGLSTDRATLEDERKARIAAVTEIYGKSPWYELRSTSLTRAQAKIKEVNDDIDARIAQAEKVAGTGAGATPTAGGRTPTSTVGPTQGGDTVTVVSNGVRGQMPRANLAEAQKRDPKLQVVQ